MRFILSCAITSAFVINAQFAAEPAQTAELDTLRGIATADKATVADLCNAIAIQRGELGKAATSFERCEQLTASGIYNFAKIQDIYHTPVTAGLAAKAAINANGLEKSLLFQITGIEWYAVQNAEGLQILPPKTLASKPLSGKEMLGLLEKAHALQAETAAWGTEKNPYEEFGVKSYEELNNTYDKSVEGEKKK